MKIIAITVSIFGGPMKARLRKTAIDQPYVPQERVTTGQVGQEHFNPIGFNQPRPFGQLVFDKDVWQKITQALGLSAREAQIVLGVFDDKKELAIAKDLGISPHTVNTYLQRLYKKLDVTSRVQLVVRVVGEYRKKFNGVASDDESNN